MADNVALTAGSGTTIGTDERSISSTNVHVQRIIVESATSVANAHTTVTNSATVISAARDTRKRLVIVNRQTVPIYVGPATVTTANGILMNPGDVVVLFTTIAVQGITTSAYTAVGNDDVTHSWEEYD